ncbi:dual oxidase maturation factor 1-like isoform X2 [Cylas formicarius]|uniref:dual oxidase maturation factor 1-like isoform X2 n=1 Tax=Cylas formicarius TaxID=197179 RepID=UPI002958B9F2|nr:dual oxidase maturation factor 1-like isoform X2 [Cylas formicarius]
MPGWFSYGRLEGFSTIYPPNFSPVTVDVLEAGIIAAFVVLTLSLCLSIATINCKQNLSVYLRVSTQLVIGLFIVLGNFGHEWEVGTKTPFYPNQSHEIKELVGIKIDLRGVNVTLKSIMSQNNRKTDYNERFEWTWDQGRVGFGPFAGKLQQQFLAAQHRGIPIPLLSVVEHFVIDGEGFRHSRYYRTAGWYVHLLMWTAFAVYLLGIIFFRMIINYGAFCVTGCGVLQLLSVSLWMSIRNPTPLMIVFDDGIIKTRFGPTFWITFFSGSACLILSAIILYLDCRYPKQVYSYFGIDHLDCYDEVVYPCCMT